MREIKTEVRVITPSFANELLINSTTKNRTVNNRNVLKYANEIKQGRWRLNGESIKLDYNGNILDGQHRLLAIINANVEIETMVTTGLDPIVFATLDTGKKRDGGDVLSTYGVYNSRAVASTIKMVKQLDKGMYGDSGSASRVLSNEDFPIIYAQDPSGYQDSVKFASKMYKVFQMALTPTLISTFDYYLTRRYSKDISRNFLERLCLGCELTEDSPILALRNRLLANKLNNKNEKLFQSDIIKYMIVGFNKYYQGKKSRQLKLPEGEIRFV